MKNFIRIFFILFICHEAHSFLDFLWPGTWFNEWFNEQSAIKSMLEGKGGVLLVDVGLEEKLFIINGTQYKCPDVIIGKTNITCPSGYTKFEITEKQDYCYAQRYSLLTKNSKKMHCFPSDNYATAFNVKSVHDIECVSYKEGAPNLFISEQDFTQMCNRNPTDPVRFEFFPNPGGLPILFNPKTVVCKQTCKFPGNMMVDRAYTFTRKQKPKKNANGEAENSEAGNQDGNEGGEEQQEGEDAETSEETTSDPRKSNGESYGETQNNENLNSGTSNVVSSASIAYNPLGYPANNYNPGNFNPTPEYTMETDQHHSAINMSPEHYPETTPEVENPEQSPRYPKGNFYPKFNFNKIQYNPISTEYSPFAKNRNQQDVPVNSYGRSVRSIKYNATKNIDNPGDTDNINNPEGYNPKGYNPKGYNPEGYNPEGYNPENYNHEEYNPKDSPGPAENEDNPVNVSDSNEDSSADNSNAKKSPGRRKKWGIKWW